MKGTGYPDFLIYDIEPDIKFVFLTQQHIAQGLSLEIKVTLEITNA